ncbi:MAG: peptidoglycan-binding domain-containing protein [Paracoccaceae bacterium]
MLPNMFTNTKRNIIAGVTAAAMLASASAPALAWGQREQDFSKGALAVILLGTVINEANKQHQQPVYNQPVYNQPIYGQHRRGHYQQPPVYYPQQPPVYYPQRPRPPVYYPPVQQSVYNTPTAQAFNSYTRDERRRIQSSLMAYGYYRGSVDGSFGPGTYNAVVAYAQNTHQLAMLNTRGGAYGFLDGLLF